MDCYQQNRRKAFRGGASYNVEDELSGTASGGYQIADTVSNLWRGSHIIVGSDGSAGGYTCTRIGAYLYKTGSPTQTITAELYSHDGVNDWPNSLLATSTTTVDASSITATASASAELFTWDFSGQSLSNATSYWVVLQTGASSNDASNYIWWSRFTNNPADRAQTITRSVDGSSWANVTETRQLRTITYSS